MSTLTKVLIVLLTLSSIFLCGIVVTYVANAENYREMYNRLRVQKDAAVENEKQAQKELNDIRDEMDTQKTELDEKNAKLDRDVERLTNDLDVAERQKAKWLDEAEKWQAITRDFYDTNDKQRQLLEDTLAKLKTIEAEQIQADKELNEKTAALREKMAIIATLDERRKQLLEEKTDLQNRLDKLLQQSGKAVAAPVPVTPTKEKARVAPPVVDIGLKGLITTVDMENSLAEISIGEENGVKQNMTFHVTRADKFICDIVILDVEPEKAVGTLKLMDVTQEQPKAGDNVSTNL